MANAPKKVARPWKVESKPFERVRTPDAFDYNCRKWRKVRAAQLALHPLCCDCEAEGKITIATVADHEPQAKVLIARGDDPYDIKWLQSLCKQHHNSKSGRERHGGGMG